MKIFLKILFILFLLNIPSVGFSIVAYMVLKIKTRDSSRTGEKMNFRLLGENLGKNPCKQVLRLSTNRLQVMNHLKLQLISSVTMFYSFY